jgi:hypothetical protein
VARNGSSTLSMPKIVAIAIGAFLAIGLAVEAPLQTAAPSTAAQRLVAGVHKKPDGGPGHRTIRRPNRDNDRD